MNGTWRMRWRWSSRLHMHTYACVHAHTCTCTSRYGEWGGEHREWLFRVVELLFETAMGKKNKKKLQWVGTRLCSFVQNHTKYSTKMEVHINHGLLVTAMLQCTFIHSGKGPSLPGDGGKKRLGVLVWGENAMSLYFLSAQLCYKPKTSLK